MRLAVTGHRPQKTGGYDEPNRLRLVAFAREQLAKLAPAQVISGMALGWDQAIAEAALDLDLPLLAAIPCDGQDSTWPFMSRRRYRELLGRPGVESHVVCPGSYKPYKMQVRNEWMVRQADLLLALFDGTAGGTANCVAYAQTQGVKIVNVWNEWIAG